MLSGGMDSIALAAWKRPEVAITVDYGQRAAPTELAVSAKVARELGMRHEVIVVDCSALGSGDMAGRPAAGVAPVPEWWPFRNQLIATLAAMRAVAIGVDELLIGSVAPDGAHADGRPSFFEALSAVMAMQEGAVSISAPAIGMTTVELVRASAVPPELLGWAHSCHTGPLACGACRGCVKHYHVTGELGGLEY